MSEHQQLLQTIGQMALDAFGEKMAEMVAAAERAEASPDDEEGLGEDMTEKERRVFYQDKVYKVCNWLDEQLRRNVTTGQGTTVEDFEESLAQVAGMIKELGRAKQEAERRAVTCARSIAELQNEVRTAKNVTTTLRQRVAELEQKEEAVKELRASRDSARSSVNVVRGALEAQKEISAERGLATERLRGALVDLCGVIERQHECGAADDDGDQQILRHARWLVGLDTEEGGRGA